MKTYCASPSGEELPTKDDFIQRWSVAEIEGIVPHKPWNAGA